MPPPYSNNNNNNTNSNSNGRVSVLKRLKNKTRKFQNKLQNKTRKLANKVKHAFTRSNSNNNNNNNSNINPLKKAARELVTIGIPDEYLNNKELNFGTLSLKETLALLIVKNWLYNNSEDYNVLKLSASNKCTKEWFKEALDVYLKKYQNLKEGFNAPTKDDIFYKGHIEWLKDDSKTLNDNRNLDNAYTNTDFKEWNQSIVKIKINDMKFLAVIFAEGFINSNHEWFTFKDDKIIGIATDTATHRLAKYCGITSNNNNNKNDIDKKILEKMKNYSVNPQNKPVLVRHMNSFTNRRTQRSFTM